MTSKEKKEKRNFLNVDTVDLLGNVQSERKKIRSITATTGQKNQLQLGVYYRGKSVYTGTVDDIKESVKKSNLSDSIKNKVANLNSDAEAPVGKGGLWRDLNIAFERDENSTSNIIINLPNKKYHIIYDITYRPWYVSLVSKRWWVASFLESGFEPPSKRPTYKFFIDWVNLVVNADSFLLKGLFIDYVNTITDSIIESGGLQPLLNLYFDKAKEGDEELRKDFGALFNLPNDPDPALPGPPTQTISGVNNKAPIIDDPNVELPSQEVAQLDPNAASQAASQARSAIGGLAGQTQGLAGSVQQSSKKIINNLSSGIKSNLSSKLGAVGGGPVGLVSKVSKKLNPMGITQDGMGKNWSPDKYSPQSIAGNLKFVDPITGNIESIKAKAQGVVGGSDGQVPENIRSAAAKLASVKNNLPKPKLSKPVNTPRIKKVKIPRPNLTSSS
jgi:hypothetical protein